MLVWGLVVAYWCSGENSKLVDGSMFGRRWPPSKEGAREAMERGKEPGAHRAPVLVQRGLRGGSVQPDRRRGEAVILGERRVDGELQ